MLRQVLAGRFLFQTVNFLDIETSLTSQASDYRNALSLVRSAQGAIPLLDSVRNFPYYTRVQMKPAQFVEAHGGQRCLSRIHSLLHGH